MVNLIHTRMLGLSHVGTLGPMYVLVRVDGVIEKCFFQLKRSLLAPGSPQE